MTEKQFSDLMWSICYPDEDIIFGGSAGEAFDKAIVLAYAIMVDGVTDKSKLLERL